MGMECRCGIWVLMWVGICGNGSGLGYGCGVWGVGVGYAFLA